MLRAFSLLFGFWLLLSACTQKVVCPAYQSAFIYDKDELRKKYSYFNEDSTPKLASVKKTKYLIAEPTSFKKKTRSLLTVQAKAINPVVPDSLLLDDTDLSAELDAAARSVIDSTYIVDTEPAAATDSVATEEEYVISVDREVRVLKYNFPDSLKYDQASGRYVAEKPNYYIKQIGFNVEQGNYLWYLRDVLVLPDTRLAKKEAEAKEEAKQKKGIKGFFSNLFKKKKKDTAPADSLNQKVSPDLDEYNYDEFEDSPRDSTSQANAQPSTAKQKKGIFSFLKRDKKPKQKAEPKPKKSEKPVKKEDEDDGF